MADGNRVAFGTPLSSITKHLYIERVGQVLPDVSEEDLVIFIFRDRSILPLF